MGLMKMKESKFGAPAGIYTGKFLGVAPFKGDGKPRYGNDGKPMEPGIEWQFEITEGDQAGQIVGRITSATPTTKNSCGVLLSGLFGRTIGPEEAVDPDQYVGHPYQIVIGPSKADPNKTQVIQVAQIKGGQPVQTPVARPPQHTTTTAASYGVSTPVPPPPSRPPARPSLAPAAGNLAKLYWVETGKDQPERMSGAEVQALMNAASDADAANQIPVMSEDQSSGWKTPADFGLVRDIPF